MEGGSCLLVGLGPRNGHSFTPFLLPVLLIKVEAVQIQGEET